MSGLADTPRIGTIKLDTIEIRRKVVFYVISLPVLFAQPDRPGPERPPVRIAGNMIELTDLEQIDDIVVLFDNGQRFIRVQDRL